MTNPLIPGIIPEGYITGLHRIGDPRIAHIYEGTFSRPGLPMCRRGWTRPEEGSYSIWRNNEGPEGICGVCLRRAREGRRPIMPDGRLATEVDIREWNNRR